MMIDFANFKPATAWPLDTGSATAYTDYQTIINES